MEQSPDFSESFVPTDVPISLPSSPPEDDLWARFLEALRAKGTDFETLSPNSNWLAITGELGFSHLESGRLLKLIESNASSATTPPYVMLIRKIGVVLEMLLMTIECRIWFAVLATFSGIILITGGTVALNTRNVTPYIQDITRMAEEQGWLIGFVAGLTTMFTLYGTWIGARVTYYKNKFAFDWISIILGMYVIFLLRVAHVMNAPAFEGFGLINVIIVALGQGAIVVTYFFCFMFGLLIGENLCNFIETAALRGRIVSGADATDQWWVRPARGVLVMKYILLFNAAIVVAFGFGFPTGYVYIMGSMGTLFVVGCAIVVALTDVSVRDAPDPALAVCEDSRPLIGYGFYILVGQYVFFFILSIWGAAAADRSLVPVFTWLMGFSLVRPLGGLGYRWLLLRNEQRRRKNKPGTWEDYLITATSSAQVLVGLAGNTSLRPGWTFVLGVISGYLIGAGTETVLSLLSAQHPPYVPPPRYAGLGKRLCPQVVRIVQHLLEVLIFFIVPLLSAIIVAAVGSALGTSLVVPLLPGPLAMLSAFTLVVVHRKFLMPAKLTAISNNSSDGVPQTNALGSPLLNDVTSFESMPSSGEMLRIARSTAMLTSTYDVVVCCRILTALAGPLQNEYKELSTFLTVLYFLGLGVLAACTRITYKALEMKQEIDPATGATKQTINTVLNFWFGAVFSDMLSRYRDLP